MGAGHFDFAAAIIAALLVSVLVIFLSACATTEDIRTIVISRSSNVDAAIMDRCKNYDIINDTEDDQPDRVVTFACIQVQDE